MRVLFSVVVCVLISSRRIASVTVANSNSSSLYTTSAADSILLPATFSALPNTTTSVYSNITTPVWYTSTTTTPYPSCTDPQSSICRPADAHKTYAITTCSITQKDEFCTPKQLNAVCFAPREENLSGWSWVKKESVANATLYANESTSELYIPNLSEFTNYTCNVSLEFNGTEETRLTSFEFQTEAEVPTEPVNLTIRDVTATSFVVNWQPPEKNPGILRGYHIEIIDLGAQYTVPRGCEHNNYTTMTNYTANTSYEFVNASSYHNYQITVWAENDVGNSTSVNTSAITNTSASLKPEAVKNDSQQLDSSLNQITANFTWRMPCQTNGPISIFNITLEGYYIPDPSVQDLRQFTVNASNQDDYFISIDKIMPASEYNFTIRADGETETGYSENFRFTTDDNVPGPPSIDIIDVGSNYIVVSWSEPEINAGYITTYEMDIKPLGPLYEYDHYRCTINTTTVNMMFDDTTRSYNFTALPYYQYQISIIANTSQGRGNASTEYVETTQSVPEQPANFEFLLQDNVTGVLSWKTPCNINGPSGNFTVLVSETYTDNSSISDRFEHTVEYRNASFNYTHEIQLKVASNYTVEVWMKSNFTDGQPAIKNLTTPDGYPGVPKSIIFSEVNANSFIFNWEPPIERAGTIQWYRITVSALGPLYNTSCLMNETTKIFEISGSDERSCSFDGGLPYSNYSVSIQANTTTGFGNITETFIVTNQSVPENVRLPQIPTFSNYEPDSEEYDVTVNITFELPCLVNGPLRYFELSMNGTRPNFDEDIRKPQIGYQNTFVSPLKPEYNYTYEVTIFNEYGSNTSDIQYFTAPAGVPTFSVLPDDFQIEMGSDTALITLRKDYFNEANGNIQYFGLYLTDMNVTGGNIQVWNGQDWPSIHVAETDMYIQITEDYWNPFKDGDKNVTTIDIGQNCSIALEKNKEYYLIIRLFTNNFFRNSPTIYFKIDDVSKLGLTLGLIFGVLIAAVIGLAGFFAWRKNMLKLPPMFLNPRKSSCNNSTQTTAFSVQKFPQYCKSLENNPEKLTEQYTLLAERTKEAVRMHTTHYAELTENRRKNRYTNILPYDETRVKLLIDEDDEIGSDYINASYVRGYSGEVEYIATQGPLPTTCRDFWKMVIQENVSIIVMVTQFIEQNKEKCYKYFPNNHESMIVGEDIEVRCSMELHFGTYCVRSIQVKKDITQVSVTHMQYLDWPDFNVPKGTETMLQFCCQFRDRLNIEGGCVIVHCSAGVGRTGTLIATDILLQNVNAGKNIDIFNTVLELRKQRTNMVQTQKQYMYIYNLIKDFLEQSQTPGFNEGLDHVYENVSVLKMKQDDDNLIATEKQTESQF